MNLSRADAGFADIGGASLYYEVAGAGHPLILLHEGFADSRMFDDQIAAFAARYRVIRYDRHGSGRSGVPTVPYTHHDALRDLLRHLDVGQASVLGLSTGGAVAIDFTLAYPEIVDTLIPVDASAVTPVRRRSCGSGVRSGRRWRRGTCRGPSSAHCACGWTGRDARRMRSTRLCANACGR